MTNEVYTENLADFGSRERKLLGEILALPLPDGFYEKGVKPAMNRNSGYVFLVNEDYQTAMINCDTGNLEIFHSTPYEGREGFLSDLTAEDPEDYHHEDVEYIKAAAETEGFELPANWQNYKDRE